MNTRLTSCDVLLVYSMRIAQQMIRAGFDMVNAKQNEQFPEKVVFYFDNTPEARRAFNHFRIQ